MRIDRESYNEFGWSDGHVRCGKGHLIYLYLHNGFTVIVYESKETLTCKVDVLRGEHSLNFNMKVEEHGKSTSKEELWNIDKALEYAVNVIENFDKVHDTVDEELLGNINFD